MSKRYREDGLKWLDEPHYADIRTGLATLDAWQESTTDQFFHEVIDAVLEDPKTYAPHLLHGTTGQALPGIFTDAALLPATDQSRKTGEIGNLPAVSATSSPALAVMYAEQAPPTLERVQDAVQYDITGPEPRTPADTATLQEVIEDALAQNSWRYAGTPLEDAPIDDTERDWYRSNLEYLYTGIVDRMGALEQQSPVVIGFGADQMGDIVGQTTLYRDEVGRAEMAEVQADHVDLSRDAVLYVPHQEQDTYAAQTPDHVTVASLAGLKAMHLARNQITYADGRKMAYEPVWDGPLRYTRMNRTKDAHAPDELRITA